MKSSISSNQHVNTAIGEILMREPFDSDPSFDLAASITLSGSGLLGSHLKNECLMVSPMSKGFD